MKRSKHGKSAKRRKVSGIVVPYRFSKAIEIGFRKQGFEVTGFLLKEVYDYAFLMCKGLKPCDVPEFATHAFDLKIKQRHCESLLVLNDKLRHCDFISFATTCTIRTMSWYCNSMPNVTVAFPSTLKQLALYNVDKTFVEAKHSLPETVDHLIIARSQDISVYDSRKLDVSKIKLKTCSINSAFLNYKLPMSLKKIHLQYGCVIKHGNNLSELKNVKILTIGMKNFVGIPYPQNVREIHYVRSLYERGVRWEALKELDMTGLPYLRKIYCHVKEAHRFTVHEKTKICRMKRIIPY